MVSTDAMLLVSMVVMIVGFVLMTRQIVRRTRELVRGQRRIVEETADLACQSLFLGALALMQLSQVIHDSGRLLPNPWISITASTGIFLMFGMSLGRLLMRWQLRHVLAELDAAKPISGLA